MSPWPCEAYGRAGYQHGARCFVAGALDQRVCTSRLECHVVMTNERWMLYARLTELAGRDDTSGAIARIVLAECPGPESLLWGESP